MPELIKTAATIKLIAPYGKGTATLEVRGAIPLFDVLKNPEWRELIDKVATTKNTDLAAMFDLFADMICTIVGVNWDITEKGKPLPITRENLDKVATGSPATVMEWLTAFAKHLPAMMAGISLDKKSRGRDLRLTHNRRTGKHARGNQKAKR